MSVSASRPERVLITGGAGFIGTNLAHRCLEQGRRVLIYDNLSRPGVEDNLRWLQETHGSRVEVMVSDVRDTAAVCRAVEKSDRVFHLAAQVAVTTSLADPVHDFEVNARGTLNVLEALRARREPAPLVFTSTNKVYGGLEDVSLCLRGARYEPENEDLRRNGIGEGRCLDFHSPYGCSKGTADQYVIDYARTFGIPAAVFRMSCIYGPHQCGNEDQGWVAHFLLRALDDEPITLFGDGKQVRDALYVEDLVEAFLKVQDSIDRTTATAFNVGGGPGNTISLLELIERIGQLHAGRPAVEFGDWRPGDQRWYVSDTRRLQKTVDWSPQVGVAEGVRRLYKWLLESRAAVGGKMMVGVGA